MEFLIAFIATSLIIGCVFGFITAKIAESRGRKESVAFFLGFFFGIFAILGYLIAGDTEELKLKRLKAVMNNQN